MQTRAGRRLVAGTSKNDVGFDASLGDNRGVRKVVLFDLDRTVFY